MYIGKISKLSTEISPAAGEINTIDLIDARGQSQRRVIPDDSFVKGVAMPGFHLLSCDMCPDCIFKEIYNYNYHYRRWGGPGIAGFDDGNEMCMKDSENPHLCDGRYFISVQEWYGR